MVWRNRFRYAEGSEADTTILTFLGSDCGIQSTKSFSNYTNNEHDVMKIK